MNRLVLLLVSIFLITIAGCGGGNGGVSTSVDSVSTSVDSVSPAPSAPSTDGVTIVWDSPSQNEDNSTLVDLAGYKIYFRQVSGNNNDPDSPLDIACTASCACNLGMTCTYMVPDNLLGTGQWCFFITAYDTSRNESTYSNEVCTTL